MNSPHVESASAIGDKKKEFAVWRPSRLVVPLLAVRYWIPGATGRGYGEERGFQSLRVVLDGFKDDPSSIRRHVTLKKVIIRTEGNSSRRGFGMGAHSYRHEPDFVAIGIAL